MQHIAWVDPNYRGDARLPASLGAVEGMCEQFPFCFYKTGSVSRRFQNTQACETQGSPLPER
jgi:hypothetical protein